MRFLMPGWRAVRFQGQDRLEWLNGQLTQDVLTQRDALFCWLEPSGRCITYGGLCFGTESVDAIVPESTVQRVLGRVDEMVVMEDLEASVLDDEAVFVPPLGLALRSSDEEPNLAVLCDFERDAALLERGFPLWNVDINERSIPLDLGDAFAQAAVSAGKGCYVGQEIIARMRARSQKPRDWVGLLLEEPVEPGSRVGSFGTVTRCSQSQTLGHIAAASISKKSLVEGEIVQIQSLKGKVNAEVRHMPLLRD